MKLLIINPWIHDFTAYDLWIQPLGLLYLAGVLQQQGFELQYIDCLADRYDLKPDGRAKFRKQTLPTPEPLKGVRRKYGRFGISPEQFRRKMKVMEPPDAILVTSGMTYWYPGVQETIREARAAFPDSRIVLGGIYATLMTEHARKHSAADDVVAGQFEEEISPFLSSGRKTSSYKNLDSYPAPAWNLLPECNYRVLLTSRGCPYRCTFCASDLLNKQRFLQRQPENVLEEISGYYFEQGIRDFVFYDDALLIGHKKHLEPLLHGILERGIRAHFHTPNGLNAREVTAEVARLFFECGFKTIRISLESSSEEIQKKQGDGKVNNEMFEHCVHRLYEAGYRPGDLECYLILGLPGQSLRSVRDSLEFVSKLGIISRLAVFSPIPGTPEGNEAQEWIGADFLEEPLLQNHASFPLKNLGISEEELQTVRLEAAALNKYIRMNQLVKNEG